MSSFIEGFVGGAFQGAAGALELQDAALSIRAKRRAEEAAKDLSEMFKEAAKAGGLSKMNDEWFTRAASSIAATGDLKNALALTEVGSTLRAKKIREAAHRASALIGAGAPGAALGDINEVFSSMGFPTQITAATETGFVTADGQQVPSEKLLDAMSRMSMTQEEFIKLSLEQMKTQAQAQRDLAAAESSRISAMATAEKLPHEIGRIRASTQASMAAAGASAAQAQESRFRTKKMEVLLPGEVQKQQIDNAKGILSLDPSTQEASETLRMYREMVKTFSSTNTVLGDMGEATRPEAMPNPLSAEMAAAGERRLLTLVESGLRGQEAINTWLYEAERSRDRLLAVNPELASDPALLTSILVALATDPNIPTQKDAEGEFMVVTLPAGQVKVYIDRAAGTEGE